MPNRDKEELSPRQLARRKVKEDGRRSGEAAHTLICMPEMTLRRLDMDPDLRDAFLKAQTIQNRGARRREERRLAGVLRRGDLDEVEEQLASQEKAGQADARLFQQAEAWRTRLLEEGRPALDAFLEQYTEQEERALHKLTRDACREHVRGKPRGAKKELFRHIATLLKEDDQST